MQATIFTTGQAVVDHKGFRIAVDGSGQFHETDTAYKMLAANSMEGSRWATLTDLRKVATKTIDICKNIDWQIVTKRPENIRKLLLVVPCEICGNKAECFGTHEGHTGFSCSICCGHGCEDGYCEPVNGMCRQNIWLLTSVENQEQADKRIPELLKCRDLSPVIGLSMEPLLGAVDLMPYFPPMQFEKWKDNGEGQHYPFTGVDWIITGGESGHNARPMHPNRSI